MKIGATVKWKSQSQGFTKIKQGKIVAIIPAGKSIAEIDLNRPRYFVALKSVLGDDWWRTHKSCLGGGRARGHESYLIVVPPGGRGKKRIYWPRVKQLEWVADAPGCRHANIIDGEREISYIARGLQEIDIRSFMIQIDICDDCGAVLACEVQK